MFLFVTLFFIYLIYLFYYLSRKLFLICRNYNLNSNNNFIQDNDRNIIYNTKVNEKEDFFDIKQE